MKYGDDYKQLPVSSKNAGEGTEVRPDAYLYTDKIVNISFIGNTDENEFILIDAGMPGTAKDILEAAKERFGENSRADAILLTHGHFDHVGSVIELSEEWDCPIYAHIDETPYLTGKEEYPKPDATVEGGMVSRMSLVFPTDPIDITDRLKPLPGDGTVPRLPDFKWIHVPGHTKGQVAFFRETDGLLISADAFVSTNQDNLYDVVTQKMEISGPPRYLTTDWKAAKDSVEKLLQLDPKYAITGHGAAALGEELLQGLNYLVQNWEEVAVPDRGKYVENNDTK